MLGREVLHGVARVGAVAAPEDDLEQRVRGCALGRQRDGVVLELFDGLFRDEQDALDGAVRRNADMRQHAELLGMARVEDGRDVADVEAARRDVAVEHGRHAAPDVESALVAAVLVSVSERQDVEKVDVSDSGLLLHRKTSLRCCPFHYIRLWA